MADKQRLTDPTQSHFLIKCPSCGQAYAIYGLMVQEATPMACAQCNALFKLRIQGDTLDAYLVSPATGSDLGPAEGPRTSRG